TRSQRRVLDVRQLGWFLVHRRLWASMRSRRARASASPSAAARRNQVAAMAGSARIPRAGSQQKVDGVGLARRGGGGGRAQRGGTLEEEAGGDDIANGESSIATLQQKPDHGFGRRR